MGNTFSKETNHLEIYLNDVFIKECIYEITNEEVVFIQKGIETLVQDITDILLADKKFNEEIEEIAHSLELEIIKPRRTNVIKVGSFYEGTRNKGPYEFDFVLPISTLRGSTEESVFEFYISSYSKVFPLIKDICQNKADTLIYSASGNKAVNDLRLVFDHIVPKNIAETLQFIYKNGENEGRRIHVDLVPAVLCTDTYLIHILNNVFPPFRHEVIHTTRETGTILFALSRFSITETEVHFMRNILSDNHKKLYRILKVIINGNSDGDKLERSFPRKVTMGADMYFIDKKSAYSSYMLKTMIIRHHYQCTNSAKTEIGPCIIQVLEEMTYYKNLQKFPFLLLTQNKFPHEFSLIPDLENLVDFFQSMMNKTDNYNYESERLQNSVSKQYADDRNIDLDDYDYDSY